MFGQIEEMQKQLQAKLAAIVIDGEAGDGKIKVQVSGTRELKNIHIDPSLVSDGDAEELEDLLLVAINRTMEKAAAHAESETKNMMSGLLPPGMDLPNIF